METYEYRVLTNVEAGHLARVPTVEKALNELGAEGFRIISIIAASSSNVIIYTLERKVQPKTPYRD